MDNKIINIDGLEIEYWYDDNFEREIEFGDFDYEHILNMLDKDYVEGEICTFDDVECQNRYGWWKVVSLKGDSDEL